MGAWKSPPDDAQLGFGNWSVSVPAPSYSLRRPSTAKKPRRGGALIVSEVAVSPENRYSFSVLKRNGDPVATFHFDALDDCFSAARAMKALLPHIARVLTRL